MVFPAIVAAVLAVHPAPWKHVVVTRAAGTVTATLAYEARSAGYGQQDLRRVTLRVSRSGKLMLARKLGFGFPGVWGRISLRFQDVWGSRPEALVSLTSCGNRCGFALYVAMPETGRLLFHEFGTFGDWHVQRHAGAFEFVTVDSRFFCNFADCASSTIPVQVLAIDAAGTRFDDVSRSRPDLLQRDAQVQWRAYRQESAPRSQYNPLGTLVPYCADEYRLGVTAYCDRVLKPTVKRQLTAWGYR